MCPKCFEREYFQDRFLILRISSKIIRGVFKTLSNICNGATFREILLPSSGYPIINPMMGEVSLET